MSSGNTGGNNTTNINGNGQQNQTGNKYYFTDNGNGTFTEHSIPANNNDEIDSVIDEPESSSRSNPNSTNFFNRFKEGFNETFRDPSRKNNRDSSKRNNKEQKNNRWNDKSLNNPPKSTIPPTNNLGDKTPKEDNKDQTKNPNFFQNLANKANEAKMKKQMQRVKEKNSVDHKKQMIKRDIGKRTGPLASTLAKAQLKLGGQQLLDAYDKGSNHEESMQKVAAVARFNVLKVKLILFCLGLLLFMIFLVFLVSFFFKNADSQIFSNENGGTVYSENYIGDDKVVNVFANYPGLYEEIMKVTDSVGKKYQVDIDKYLIIATLVAPISNELIVPVEDGSCGEEKCYYFDNQSVTWSEFLKSWSHQAELLAKMQILTYTNNDDLKIDCGPEQTMEQYAKNDKEIHTFEWYGWLNPVNWFKGFVDATEAEVNAKCVTARSGSSKVPIVRELSVEQGEYYIAVDENKNDYYVKDPNSGGVYFWNLVNQNGFIHEYLKDYLSNDYLTGDGPIDPDKNYEINKRKIIEIANYIYSYYDTIRKDCNNRPVMKGELKKIKFREDKDSPVYSLDFEEVFVGGNLLATFPGAKGEVAKAQAIATRSEAYYNIVMEGSDMITGTQIMGCWWWKYNPTYDPSYENQADNPKYDPDYPKEHFPEIYKAVTETRGILVTPYGGTNVLNTQFDSFCPVTRDPQGGFYYLPDGQRKLPIDVSRFAVPKNRTECPCFQNKSSRPSVEYTDTFSNLLSKYVGRPAQTTTEACWEPDGSTKTDLFGNVLYGYKYSTTGGHGEGISQHGMAYYAQFGYDYEALLKLFLDRDNKGISLKRYDDSLLENECNNSNYYDPNENKLKDDNPYGENINDHFSDTVNTNFTEEIGGSPLTKPLADALADRGHTIQDLNDCILGKVREAGPGTRDGVVAAGLGLLTCMMDLTGGYTLPYDHSGGKVGGSYNPDLTGKLGVNSKWGVPGGGGCKEGTQCRYGLNCATFVRWAMCNGGMDLCSRGSAAAHEMYDTTYFPEAIKIRLNPGFSVLKGNTSISSAQVAVNMIKPGDALYSNAYPDGGANHIMLVVGVDDNAVTIAENGRKTIRISKSALVSSREKEYGVLLLDDYYANTNNRNNLFG